MIVGACFPTLARWTRPDSSPRTPLTATDRAFAEAEACEGAESFAPAHRAPLRAISRFQEKLPLNEALRPRIVFAVGDEDDLDVTLSRDVLLFRPARRRPVHGARPRPG